MLQHTVRLFALLLVGMAIAGCQSLPVGRQVHGESRVVLPGPRGHDESRVVSLESGSRAANEAAAQLA